MGEGHVQKFVQSMQTRLIFAIGLMGLIFIILQWSLESFLPFSNVLNTIILLILWLFVSLVTGSAVGQMLSKPTRYIAQAILHISPSEHLTAAPNVAELGFGKELVSTLTRQVYDYATVANHSKPAAGSLPAGLFDQLPVAVIGLDESSVISLSNSKAKATTKSETLTGQQLNNTLRFLTDDEMSIDSWIIEAREKTLTATRSWQKVAVKTINNESLGYFDIAVSFNKHSASGVESLLTFYDHSEAYNTEEAEVGFVALAVHELRTPVTILRGYIEAFGEELGVNTTPQIADDLQKMNASAENLSSFVSNILNVARINQGQLSLKLEVGSWNTVLPQIVDNLRNRAGAYGKVIELRMQPDLPEVALDRMTIGEVITNLVDNSIKYTPQNAPVISIISKLNNEGLVETTVTDKGVGIPSSVMPNLFSKFYRNHRNQANVGGTGLGLFLSKAIITAHSGHIWASSKENEGSTFGFTLLPYTQLASELQTSNTSDIVRGSHGWIKNHSMQRR